jgi:predicted aspartyl protease
MDSVRPFLPRRQPRMGEVVVQVTVTNGRDPGRKKTFEALVDTGAYGLVLPLAWKEALGDLELVATADLETADQRVVEADIYGPVWIQIDGFRRVIDEVIFVEMEPGPQGYQPLVGCTVLEKSNVFVDAVTHRLVARKYYNLKSAAVA